MSARADELACIRCGCTQDEPCRDALGRTCARVIEGLCSACVTEEELAAIGKQIQANESVGAVVDPRSWRKPEPRFRKVYA